MSDDRRFTTKDRNPPYSLHIRLGGNQSQSEYFGEDESLLLLTIEPLFLGRPTRSLVTILIELSRLLTASTKWENICEL